MKIEHVPGNGEKIVLGKLSKFLLVSLVGIIITFFGFLYKDRISFEHRLTLLEEISIKQSKLLEERIMEHDNLATQYEYRQLKESINRIEASVSRLENTLVFDKAKK